MLDLGICWRRECREDVEFPDTQPDGMPPPPLEAKCPACGAWNQRKPAMCRKIRKNRGSEAATEFIKQQS
jgi:hypothetical protein